MILTIGMIVKNEEKYLRRCLTALSPILAQVESELIIADTGSTDNTVEIAKEFTRNVFHFEWCNDFSAARNSTMKRAKGSWFFSIDADEILTDAKEIIDFFNSGEYKKFNSAAITIRSANDAGFKTWNDLQAPRLIKLKDDSYFINPIHEKFGRIYEPVKHLPTIANHYGYVTQGNEEYIEYKMSRNLNMVLDEIKQNPSDCMLYIYACDACSMIKDYKQALEYCEKGLSYAKKQNNQLMYILLAKATSVYFNMENYIKAIETSDEYFRSKQEQLATDVEVNCLKAESCFLLHRYRAAILSYLDYFEGLKKRPKNTFDEFLHPIAFVDERSYRVGILRLAKAYLEEGDLKSALERLHSVPATDFQKDKDNVPYWLDLEIGMMKKTKDFSGIKVLYIQLEAAAREVFQTLLEKEMADSSVRDAILTEFKAQSGTGDAYVKLLKLRRDYYAGNLTAGPIQEFLSDTEELKPLFADAVYFAVKLGLPLKSIAERIDPLDIGSFFFYNSAYHFDDMACLVYDTYGESADADAVTQQWLLFLYYLGLTSGHVQEEYITTLFKEYARAAFIAITLLFKEELLREENIRLLPRQFRVGYYCHMAEDALETGKDTLYIRYLRTALKLCPLLNKAVQVLAEQIKSSLDPADERQSEFEMYARKVKATIRDLINNGKHNEAGELIQTFESICPADPEIKSLKERITNR